MLNPALEAYKIEKDGRVIIDHPFFLVNYYDERRDNEYNRNFACLEESVRSYMARGKYYHAIKHFQGAHQLRQLYTLRDLVSDHDFWLIVRECWERDNLLYCRTDEYEKLFELDRGSSGLFMSYDDLIRYSQFPNMLRIYRGFSPCHGFRGISWSMSPDVALRYSRRNSSNIIAIGLVDKSDVIGYINDNLEHEIVVSSRNAIQEADTVVYYPRFHSS